MERPDPLDLSTLDGRVWLVWRNYPAGPLPEDPRERDLNAFAAGVKATVLAFIGDEGDLLADTLIAGLLMRDAMTNALDREDERRREASGRDEGPGREPGPSQE
jgi:hypothetical protein